MKRLRAGLLIAMMTVAGIIGAFAQIPAADLQKAMQAGSAPIGTGTSQRNETNGTTLPEASARAVMAMSTEDYPATPGDIYTLVYLKITQLDTLSLVVEGDGSINAGFLGKFSSKGLSFRQLKAQIEKKVQDSYPGSNPSLIISSTGLFPVLVKGEVSKSDLATAWGLSRLSETVSAFLSPYSSLRDVEIKTKEGRTSTYDLFKARRAGDLGQDPYVRPGDVVTVRKAERIVALEGEIRRAGTYQLLAGEGMAELVAYYGDGTLRSARTDRAVLTRRASADKPQSESLVFDLSGKTLPELFDGDKVRLPSREEYLPVVYVEGSSRTGEQRILWRKGLLLSQAMLPLVGALPPDVDLRSAYLVKAQDKSVVRIDLDRLLFAHDSALDRALEADDRIVLPMRTPSVFVSGEVGKAGFLPVSGAQRLSEVLKPFLLPYSSLRNVKVTSMEGVSSTYDLFLAERLGDAGQNPLLRPGDRIEVSKAARIVEIEGEVRRPGAYQILDGEGVRELVGYYGASTLPGAQSDLTVLVRRASADKPHSESLVFDLSAKTFPELLDGDKVRVPSREEYLPVVYIEGAVAGSELGVKKEAQAGNAEAMVTQQYRVVRLVHRQGQLLSQALRGIREQIDPRADLKRAFITRKGQTAQISVDLEKLLYRYDPAEDFVLKADDRVVVPYGSMYIFATGEVKKSTWVGITGLTRLSEVVKPLTTPYSSLRDVAVSNEDGSKASYDLFIAERKGDLSQDPYLRPGDLVTIKKADRIVAVEGEIRRVGAYQLLAGEGVAELVTLYGDGTLESARTDRAVLTRRASADKPQSESLVFDLGGKDLPALADGDRVRIPSREEYLPVVYVEGAVEKVNPATPADPVSPVVSELKYLEKRVLWRKGLLLSQAMLPLVATLPPDADLRSAYLVKSSDKSVVKIDLDRLLFAHDRTLDRALEADDRVVLPFKTPSVFVSGEVNKAGFFPVSGAQRLSEVLKPFLLPYSSLRNVKVTSAEGVTSTYDLFKAERFGDAGQNPLLRPGDRIEVAKATRIVVLAGEANRPGTYEILSGEGLEELIAVAGAGLKEFALRDRILVTRKASDGKPQGESLVVQASEAKTLALMDGDTVTVPSREEYLPVVYVEGAVEKVVPADPATPANPVISDLKYLEKRILWRKGLLLSQAMLPLVGALPPDADLRSAYLVKSSDKSVVKIDLDRLLFAHDRTLDRALEADDRIVLPFRTPSVFVSGEVSKAGFAPVAGIQRLSEVLKPFLLPHSSLRNVKVTSTEGVTSTYDLFKAERFGDAGQNPLLRPGDRIEVAKATRIVVLAGEANRPGTYEILSGEGLEELIAVAGAGLKEFALRDRILVTRKASDGKPQGESLVVQASEAKTLALMDGDTVTVPSREEYLPVVYVEGAVEKVIPVAPADPGAPVVSELKYLEKRVLWRQGLLLSQAMLPLVATLPPDADLRSAYLVKAQDKSVVKIDLDRLLFAHDRTLDRALEADDRVVLPFKTPSVFVSGEVNKAGFFPVSGAQRLSEVLKPFLLPYSSLRNVKVTSAEGVTSTYDLFKAERFGDAGQNPLLRPGDRIEVAKATRIVSLEGDARRAGTYQLLAGEGVAELVTLYGDGTLESARTDRAVLTRRASTQAPQSESLVFDLGGKDLPALTDGDKVRIPSREEYLPVVYVEGAAKAGAYSEQRILWRKGLLLSQAMLPLVSALPPDVDLRSAYLVKAQDKSVVRIDLDRLLFAHDRTLDRALEADDRVVLPFKTPSVFVSGEVSKAGFAPVAGTQRLSEVLKPFLLPYSSLRNVKVTSAEGVTSTYDLFKAERFGDAGQNPLLRPGDRIEVAKAARIVVLAGEANRPGTYEILSGEGLEELIAVAGAGLKEFALRDRILVTRKASDGKPQGESLVVQASEAKTLALMDGDTVTVPSREEYLPVVYVEGAMAAGGYGIQRILWRQGLMASQALKPLAAGLPPAADLRKARIQKAKDGTSRAIDLEKLLFASDLSLDAALDAGDRIILPYGSRDVYISGEVAKSGWVQADGTLRLSQSLKDYALPTSSLRTVKIRNSEGKEVTYDLFRAERFGEMDQNPVLSPGDAILVSRAGRTVSLEGEVYRPGAYELLASENLAALLAVQGGGIRPSAQADRIQVARKATQEKAQGEIAIADARAGSPQESLPILYDGDKVRVPSRDEYLPVVYIEGAVAGEYSVQRVTWKKGMKVADLIRPLRDTIPPSADLKKAFIAKNSADRPVEIDLEKILYSYDLAYDMSLEPEDRLVIPLGSMFVFVTGEVQKSAWVEITGLTRLREVVGPNLTRWSSTRAVKVSSRNGLSLSYDLFKAERYGDLSQDPFLRPGDTVTVERLERIVTIGGEVRRPGSYQLLEGEGMKDLVERYADGFTEKANPSRIEVVRYLSPASPVGEKLQFDYKQTPDFALNQYDAIAVPAWQDLLPVAWFEGAVGVGTAGAALEAAKRMPHTFFPGETVAEAAQAMRKNFSEVSDLAAAYISRKGARIPVDLAKFLYDRSTEGNLRLEANDVIVVPFRQFFVTVSGAVRLAGRYPYVPDRSWEYYVGLAGGFDPDRNVRDKVTIHDVNSKKVPSSERIIMPEDTIFAETNSLMYKLLKIASVLSTALSIVAVVISLAP